MNCCPCYTRIELFFEMKKYWWVVVCIGFAKLGNAQLSQADSARQLNAVFISGLRITQLNNATFIQTLSANELLGRQGSTMAEVLQENTPIFIRNYGSGGLATASFRGSNAYHTPVIWNGINIQNPMNGQIDFSAIPVFLSDELSLQYGGNGGIWGSGAMAGLLVMNSSISTQEKLKVELLTSAFDYNLWQNGVKLSLGNKKWFSSTKIFTNIGNNNFAYAYKGETHYQKNASINDKGFQQVLAYKKDIKNTFTGLIWYNESSKQIAPNLSANYNNAIQKDKNIRTAITWNQKLSKASTEAKLAYYYDEIFFESNDIPKSLSKSHTYNLSLEHQTHLNKTISMHGGIINWLAFANVDGYEQAVNQNRLAGFAFIKTNSKWLKLQQQLGLRAELVNDSWIPLMPSYFLQSNLSKLLTFKLNIARTYRLPTFNDLYWKNGGNVLLQSEQGWNSDCALSFNKRAQNMQFDVGLSIFYRSTENYIQWIPINSALFSPINIGNVLSRGFEINSKVKYIISKHSALQFNYLGSFLQAFDTENSRQLIFTPRIKHVVNLIYDYNQWMVKYNHTYTGVSFTKSDLTAWNDDFHIGNFTASKTFQLRAKNQLNLQGSINNCWNTAYAVMPDRPMPLRNFQITIQYIYN